MNGISNKSLLVTLNISQWTARKLDKTVTLEVAASHNADMAQAGNYRKSLLNRESLKKIAKVVAKARTFHYENTLPWSDEGTRLLPSANFFDYTSKIRAFREQFETSVEEFADAYTNHVIQAEQMLGSLFNPDDYPNIPVIKNKYRFVTSFSPVPDSGDFRVDIDESELDEIKKDVEDRVRSNTETAMRDLWDRVYESVNRMAETLPKFNPSKSGKERGLFRNSLVGNIANLVELLPKMNLTGDETLESMRRELESKLCKHSATELRENRGIRERVAADANNLAESITKCTEQKGTI